MIKGGKEGGERAVTRTTKKEKRKKKSILKNGEKRGNSFSLFLFLSFFLPLSRVYQRERNKEFERQISIETAHQVRPAGERRTHFDRAAGRARPPDPGRPSLTCAAKAARRLHLEGEKAPKASFRRREGT